MEFTRRNIQKNYKRNNDVAFVSGLSKDTSNNSGTNIPSLSNKLDKSVWDEHFYLDENGNLHSKKNFVSDLGLTSYGKGYREVATIMDGVVTDETTISKQNGILTVIGGTSGGGGASNWDELEGKPTWITDTKPTYNWNEIIEKPTEFTPSAHTHTINNITDLQTILDSKIDKTYVDNNFVTLTTEQNISGTKHFINGYTVGINKHKIYEDNGVVYIDADVAITGAITAYAQGERSVSTIMDAIICDETTITKQNGKLTVIGGVGGASNWDELEGKPTWITDTKPTYNWNEITSKPSTFTPSVHTHTINNITNLQDELDGKSNVGHTHTISNITNLQATLDNKANSSHTHSQYVNKAGDTMQGNLTLPRINIKGTSNSDAYISADATNNMYISLADEVIVNFNPITFRPSLVKNGVVSLGSSESRWNELYTNGLTVNKSVSSYLSNNNPVGINCTNTNPYLGFYHNGKKWYVQAYNNNLYLGITANQSVKIDESGKLNAAGGLSSSSSTILQFDKYAYKDVLKYGWTSAEGDYIDWKLPGTSEPKYVRLSHNKGLQAFCNILSTGGITCYTSDARLKNKIEDISLSLEDIANSPTIKFRWNNTKIKDDGKIHIGGLAQYTQKILPEAVIESDEILNMDYATTAYIFAVQTAKHLQDINNKLQNKIEELENKIIDIQKNISDEKNNTMVN